MGCCCSFLEAPQTTPAAPHPPRRHLPPRLPLTSCCCCWSCGATETRRSWTRRLGQEGLQERYATRLAVTHSELLKQKPRREILSSLFGSRTHPCLEGGALSFPVDVTMKAVDSGGGAHHIGLLVSAEGVNVSELTGQRRHFVIVADTRRETRR